MLSAALVVFALTGPPVDLGADYQLGSAYRPAEGVGVVARDAGPSPLGAYSICYVNAFQAQPGCTSVVALGIRTWCCDPTGKPIVDENWGEMLLDTGTRTNKGAGPASSARWIDVAAAVFNFDAVEPDSLDSWQRSGDFFDVVTTWLSRILIKRAHKRVWRSRRRTPPTWPPRHVRFTPSSTMPAVSRMRQFPALTAIGSWRSNTGAGLRLGRPMPQARLPIVYRDVNLAPRGSRGYRFRHR